MLNNLKRKKFNYKEFLYINFGIFIMATSFHFFTAPNKFTLGGVSGISILITNYIPNLSIGSINIFFNIILFIIGIMFLEKQAMLKSAYGSLVFSFMIYILENLIPINETLTNNQLLELIYSVFIPGIGISIVFSYGGTTGGTEILAKIINKYFKIKLSVSLLILDFTIASLSLLIYNIEIFLFSMLGVFIKSFTLDSFMETINLNKIVVITCEDPEPIVNFITNNLKRGATCHNAKGVYTNKDKIVITTILSRKQAANLQNYVDNLDKNTFITISNSSRIIGKGFKKTY